MSIENDAVVDNGFASPQVAEGTGFKISSIALAALMWLLGFLSTLLAHPLIEALKGPFGGVGLATALGWLLIVCAFLPFKWYRTDWPLSWYALFAAWVAVCLALQPVIFANWREIELKGREVLNAVEDTVQPKDEPGQKPRNRWRRFEP